MGEVVSFPLHRRHALVHEAASLIERKSADGATRYWKMTVRRLQVELGTYGLGDDEIERQLRSFSVEVMALHHQNTGHFGGAA